MLVNIWVKDNCTGNVHQVGTDPHDSLDSLDGKVEYYNLQNGDGTPTGYSFVPPPDGYDMEEYTGVIAECMKAFWDAYDLNYQAHIMQKAADDATNEFHRIKDMINVVGGENNVKTGR